jgi:hypothetical protein
LETKKKPKASCASLKPVGAAKRATASVSIDPTLHPSWQAKKQINSGVAILKSTGTKIVFDRDDDESIQPNPKPQVQAQVQDQSSKSKVLPFAGSVGLKRKGEEELHPSWQAKKRNSAAIQTSLGTKITFD